jgi:hypothetical protein
MNTKNHTSPSGEDAANGAMGERGRDVDIADFLELIDAYQCAQKDGTHDERANARIALMNAYRAAIAAGGAQEAIGWYEAEQSCRGADVRHLLSGAGQMMHSGRFHWTAERPDTSNPVWSLYAAPQQPAQSAEQDERAEFLSGRDVEELFLRWSEWTTELGEAISRKNIDGFVSDLRALLAAKPADGGKS